MPDHKKDGELTLTDSALIGAGVGAAGVGSSVGIIGLAAGIALLPFCLILGLIGGAAWWAVTSE